MARALPQRRHAEPAGCGEGHGESCGARGRGGRVELGAGSRGLPARGERLHAASWIRPRRTYRHAPGPITSLRLGNRQRSPRVSQRGSHRRRRTELLHAFDRICGEISRLGQPAPRALSTRTLCTSLLHSLAPRRRQATFLENDRGSSRQVPALRRPTGSPTSLG